MPFKDLREFIARLEQEGEARQIEEEVDWNLEAGAIFRRSAEAGLPAPFLQKVRDYPNGYRLFGGALANYRRIAIAMDMEPNISGRELMEEYLRRKRQPVKPLLVRDGPCKENIHLGSEVDVLEFPVPLMHEGDGGRYIGTWHLVITKDSGSDWVNWGMYRIMVHNKNTLAMHAAPYTHLGIMYNQGYVVANRPMEVAIAIGVEPVSTMCAAAPMPYGICEVDIAGGIRGGPVELVKCETVDLAVPATAEIVIEGEIKPGEKMDEGPFGEFTGYIASPKAPCPVLHVKAVTHRNKSILSVSCPGVPVYDEHAIGPIVKGAEYLEALQARGLPVTGVCLLPETSGLLLVVSVKVPYSRVAEEIAHVVWGTRGGRSLPYLIIVDDDVDPFNTTQVLHALTTKCHPNRGIIKQKEAVGTPLLPWANAHERKYRQGARVYFDCTWPLDWDQSEVPKRVSFEESYPSEIQQKALSLLQDYD